MLIGIESFFLCFKTMIKPSGQQFPGVINCFGGLKVSFKFQFPQEIETFVGCGPIVCLYLMKIYIVPFSAGGVQVSLFAQTVAGIASKQNNIPTIAISFLFIFPPVFLTFDKFLNLFLRVQNMIFPNLCKRCSCPNRRILSSWFCRADLVFRLFRCIAGNFPCLCILYIQPFYFSS